MCLLTDQGNLEPSERQNTPFNAPKAEIANNQQSNHWCESPPRRQITETLETFSPTPKHVPSQRRASDHLKPADNTTLAPNLSPSTVSSLFGHEPWLYADWRLRTSPSGRQAGFSAAKRTTDCLQISDLSVKGSRYQQHVHGVVNGRGWTTPLEPLLETSLSTGFSDL